MVETPVQIDDYQETVASRIEMSKKRSGNQQGDPVRGAEAIITAVLSESDNLRLLLGKPALDMAYEKLEKSKKNYDAWKDLTLSADFPE